jgi:hypothetical protein
MSVVVEAMVVAAKAWRGLARLVVLVEDGGAEGAIQEIVVKLGPSRRRWKRVAETVAPMAEQVAGARGYDAAGELIGAWDAPEDEGPEEHELSAETDDQAAHRQHTQWCLREAAKMFESSTKLTTELVLAVIEIVRALRANVATPDQQATSESDETTKTLGLILQSVMGNNHGKGDDEAKREERSQSSDTDGQGQSSESAPSST